MTTRNSPFRFMARYLPGILPSLLVACPAHAAGGVVLPEPSSLLLLGMGITGVIVGRQLSHRKGGD